MKIMQLEDTYFYDKETDNVDCIGLKNKVFVDAPFILSGVQHKEIDNGMEFITLPYVDDEFQKAIGGLAYEIATNNDWIYPDYDNVKLSILVHTDSDNFKASLCIQVQPPHYSEEEKTAILDMASKDMFCTDFSEYTNWLDIFASAKAFHNGNNGGISETIGIYDIDFTLKEQNTLQWFLIQHLQMLQSDGYYVD